MSRVKFMNIEIDNLTMDEAIEEICRLVEEGIPSYAVTPNVDHMVKLETDQELMSIYRDASLVLTDGMPIVWASHLYRRPIKEKISGSDLFPLLCKRAAERGYRMYFLGAAEGVADKAAENLQKSYPELQVVGTYSPPIGFEYNHDEIGKIINTIRDLKPDILVIGLGSPKQEKYIYRYYKRMGIPFSIGLGASFDFAAGRIRRAPRWMSRNGLEWLFRLIMEPKRLFKRYVIDDRQIFKLIWKYRKDDSSI